MAEQTTTDYLSTRLPDELLKGIDQLAEEQRWTRSFAARVLIEEALEARAKKAKKQ